MATPKNFSCSTKKHLLAFKQNITIDYSTVSSFFCKKLLNLMLIKDPIPDNFWTCISKTMRNNAKCKKKLKKKKRRVKEIFPAPEGSGIEYISAIVYKLSKKECLRLIKISLVPEWKANLLEIRWWNNRPERVVSINFWIRCGAKYLQELNHLKLSKSPQAEKNQWKSTSHEQHPHQ